MKNMETAFYRQEIKKKIKTARILSSLGEKKMAFKYKMEAIEMAIALSKLNKED